MRLSQFQAIVNAFQAVGLDPGPYSGRCMVHAQCLGVECDNPISAVLKAVSSLAETNDGSELRDLIALIQNARIDSMGCDSLLYFPDVKWDQNVKWKEETERGTVLSEFSEFTKRLRNGVLAHVSDRRSGASVEGIDPHYFLNPADLSQLRPSGSTFRLSETPSGGGRQFQVRFTSFDPDGHAFIPGPYGQWPSCSIFIE